MVSPSALELIRGELWFEETAPGSPREFRVATKFGEVVLKGALAGLRLDDQALTASLVSGEGVVRTSGGEVAVRGGQEAVADASGARLVHIRDPSGLVSWTGALRQAVRAPIVKKGEFDDWEKEQVWD